MKLLTYDTPAGPRAGVLQNDRVLDVQGLLGESRPLRDVQALLELPGDPLAALRSALTSALPRDGQPLAEVTLRAPIIQPPTVRDFFCFEEHASRWGSRGLSDAWYRLPIFYFSNPLCIYGPNTEVPFPSATDQLDYELELAVVVGKEGRNISREDAWDYIAGFTILNDWSCRDLQRDEMQATLGPAKGKDAATSLGPWLVTTDEIAPLLKDGRLAAKCTLTVNGEQWMDGDGSTMYHDWASFIVRASRDSRIVPGDVIGSGTVGGGSIGEAMLKGYAGARWLQPGDQVAMTVDGIGTLANTLGPKPALPADYPYIAKPPAQ